MKKLILLVLMLSAVAVIPCQAKWKTLQQIFNAVYNESEQTLNVTIGTQTYTVDVGTVIVKGLTSDNFDSTGVDVSSKTYTTISARPTRLSILFKNNDLEKVFYREQNTNITTQGNFIDGGESYSRDDYTGVFYLLTEEGKAPQNIRIEEVYE